MRYLGRQQFHRAAMPCNATRLPRLLPIGLLLCFALWFPGVARGAGCAPIAALQPFVSLAAVASDAVTVTFLGHASFLIESPAGVTAVTDYNAMNVPSRPPDIATMNHAHSLHYTDSPDPHIRYVLRGWRDDGRPATIDLAVGDMHVTNLPTNIRDGQGGTEQYGNSIFIFQTAGLCVAHLSHLHHLLEPQDLAALGHIDVVMAPVDGAYTLSLPDLMTVLDQIQPRVVLPMHYFARSVLDRFLAEARPHYAVIVQSSPTVALNRETLPDRPTVVALPSSE